MSSSRQLAAIMFTDVVGYTALMGKDEQKAFALLKKNREFLAKDSARKTGSNMSPIFTHSEMNRVL